MTQLLYTYTSKSGEVVQTKSFAILQELIAQGGDYVVSYEPIKEKYLLCPSPTFGGKRKRYVARKRATV